MQKKNACNKKESVELRLNTIITFPTLFLSLSALKAEILS